MTREIFGMVSYQTLKRQLLARKTLETKWAEPLQTNNVQLCTMCPFCADTWANGGTCADCFVPPELCAAEGHEGLIGTLYAKHGDVKLKCLPAEDFRLMRASLEQLAKFGQIVDRARVPAAEAQAAMASPRS
ncbi:MAG: hypothetical protein RBG13Loki_0529 [Promethearchaeota archaeon CR_4]|nr:MAG: hypothetical protein RBG13Loki_0529 [Candidatus Lokiarchaeota archaeon CR_4]